jgi:hypothetical protein
MRPYNRGPVSQQVWHVCLFRIFRHTQQFVSYMMTVSHLLVEERTSIHYIMYLGRDHRPSASKLTNFLTQSHRYGRESNWRRLEVRGLVVWDRCLNHSTPEAASVARKEHLLLKATSAKQRSKFAVLSPELVQVTTTGKQTNGALFKIKSIKANSVRMAVP